MVKLPKIVHRVFHEQQIKKQVANWHHPVTRSHKQNDRDHAGLADGTADDIQHLPRYFAKHGHVDADPKKVKKEGGGKGNW